MPALAHIVSLYKAPTGSEHNVSIPIVMESMLRAKANSKGNVELFAAIFKGDEDLVPQGFTIVYLERSLKDVANFKNARPLPLITDVLDLLDKSKAEYFIYTNADIILQPDFYTKAAELTKKGYDGIIINRRGISPHFNSVEQLTEMYAEKGKKHPGFDCFIFKRQLKEKFLFGNICIGIPRFERVFALNMICFCERFILLDEEHLTLHIGKDVLKKWGNNEHYAHNQREYLKIRKLIFKDLRINKFPYWKNSIFKRYWKWLWNPNFSFPDNLILEWRYRIKGY